MNKSNFSMIRMFLFLLILSSTLTTNARAAGMNIRSLNMAQFHYPVGQVIQKRQDDYSAELTMLAADAVEKAEKFYLGQGFKQVSKDAGRKTIKLLHMIAPHVPVTATLIYDNPYSGLSEENIFGDNLMMSVMTGTHTTAELTQLKQKYAYLKRRFYASDPRAVMKECRKPAKNQIAKKQMTAEERGRKMQELVMQGKYDEANTIAASFTAVNQDLQNEATKDRWGEEIKCLKKLDKESFKIQIKIFVERDDVLG